VTTTSRASTGREGRGAGELALIAAESTPEGVGCACR